MTNIEDLHAEFREFRAEMRGALQTLTATKVGEHRVLETEQTTIAKKVDAVKGELDEVKDDLSEVRDDVSSVRSEFRTAIAHARGWIAGAAAIAGVIAGVIATVGADIIRSVLNIA